MTTTKTTLSLSPVAPESPIFWDSWGINGLGCGLPDWNLVGKPVTIVAKVALLLDVENVMSLENPVADVVISHRLALWLKEHTMSDVAPTLDLHSSTNWSSPSPQHFEHGRQLPLASKYLANHKIKLSWTLFTGDRSRLKKCSSVPN